MFFIFFKDKFLSDGNHANSGSNIGPKYLQCEEAGFV